MDDTNIVIFPAGLVEKTLSKKILHHTDYPGGTVVVLPARAGVTLVRFPRFNHSLALGGAEETQKEERHE